MATRLTLICHARTLAQKLARFPLDEPVELDWQAAGHSLADRFKPSVHLLSAPEIRARQTAHLFGSQMDIVPELRDCDFGHWQGKRIKDLQAHEPEALQAWSADSASTAHGGESVAEVCARVGAWLDTLRMQGHFVAITHPFVIRAAILHALQCPTAAFNSIDIEPLSATELRFNGRWRLRMQEGLL